jgi:hypothetical protein
MDAGLEDHPQLVNSGIAIRCEQDEEPLSATSAIPLLGKRKTVNPFAKRGQPLGNFTAKSNAPATTDFARSSILPAPRRRIALQTGDNGVLQEVSPVTGTLGPAFHERTVEPTASTEKRSDKKWRLLWRGGLEVGPEGYKLEGKINGHRVSFDQLLNFHPGSTQVSLS